MTKVDPPGFNQITKTSQFTNAVYTRYIRAMAIGWATVSNKFQHGLSLLPGPWWWSCGQQQYLYFYPSILYLYFNPTLYLDFWPAHYLYFCKLSIKISSQHSIKISINHFIYLVASATRDLKDRIKSLTIFIY